MSRILVVEDNQAYVENLREILTDIGHEVRSAPTCQSARALARGWLDVALVDLMLPDGNGTTLATQLKEDSPDCEIILLTGNASVESAAAAVRAGVWAYLIKPCSVPDLLATLDKATHHVATEVERREMARRARVAEKLAAVGTLTAGLSHEIRNPLNAAALQLAVLERRVRRLDDAQQPGLLEPLSLVQDEIRRLEHILQDFLQFARPIQLRAEPTPIHPLLERVTHLLQSDAERREVHLEVCEDHGCVVVGDSDQLRQVFMNLALNALDATPSGGRVMLSAEAHQERDDLVIAAVDDSGPGVPENTRERIFEPFFTTKALGSGLGLPITNAIVQQHGGSIAVLTSSLGGARFEVRLPRGTQGPHRRERERY